MAPVKRTPTTSGITDHHGNRLAQHGRLGLDAADAPAEHRQAVDHGGVAVGAHTGVRVGQGGATVLLGPDHLGQVFQIDLVADAGAGRHDPEVVEGALAPAQKGVALAVALELHLHVFLKRARGAEGIDHDRVVDHQINRRQGIDLARIAAQVVHRFAHGGQIDHGGNAGEILQQDPRRAVGNLPVGAPLSQPRPHGADVVGRDRAAVLVAQQVFQQDFERTRQTGQFAQAGRGGRLQAIIGVVLVSDGQGLAGLEAILAGAHGIGPRSSAGARK
jgi:hypothetical protein